MNNLKQVQLICDALTKKKDILLVELQKISVYIKKRIDSLSKIIAYQKEYAEINTLKLSKSTPILYKNLDSFSNSMSDLIKKEEKEISNLTVYRENKINQIREIDQKINAMNQFKVKIEIATNTKLDNDEQWTLDELSSIKQRRGDYE